MFERFTKAARMVVVEAQENAQSAHATSVDTDHLLLALLARPRIAAAVRAAGADPTHIVKSINNQAGSGIDAGALASIGINFEEINRKAEETFGPGALAGAGRRRHLKFSADAKKMLELGLREALRLGDRTITARHLMLGLIRADCTGRRTLARFVSPTSVRTELTEPRQAAS